MFCNKSIALSFLSLLFLFSELSADLRYIQEYDYAFTITDAQTFVDPADTCFQMQLSDGSYWQTEWERPVEVWAHRPFDVSYAPFSAYTVKEYWHVGDHILLLSEQQTGYVRWKAVNLDRDNATAYIVPGWNTH